METIRIGGQIGECVYLLKPSTAEPSRNPLSKPHSQLEGCNSDLLDCKDIYVYIYIHAMYIYIYIHVYTYRDLYIYLFNYLLISLCLSYHVGDMYATKTQNLLGHQASPPSFTRSESTVKAPSPGEPPMDACCVAINLREALDFRNLPPLDHPEGPSSNTRSPYPTEIRYTKRTTSP